MKNVPFVIVLALVLAGCSKKPFVPDGSRPMSTEHRTLRDPQGHLDDVLTRPGTNHKWCDGHVKEVIRDQTGDILIVCRPAETITP